MKDRSLLMAALVGALSGTLLGAGTFYYAELISYSAANPNAVNQEMSLRNYFQGEYEIRTKRDLHGRDIRRNWNSHAVAPTEDIAAHCEGLSGSRYTKCQGNAQDGVRFE